jgi:polyhydroxybutyrate depolymerase
MRVSRIVKAMSLLALALVATTSQAAVITPVDIARTEGTRHYLFAEPDHLTAGKHPLVILLHGHGGSAEQLLGQEGTASPLSVWLKIADREQVLIAAADGLKGADNKRGWNDCRSDAPSNPQVDDEGFINAIIDREIAQHNVDPARVFVMGFSNGAIMTYRVATDLGSKLAGFAAVSGAMAAKSLCDQPKTPVSALIVSGTADPLVPYEGGDVHLFTSHSRGSVIGVESSVDVWRKRDGLAEPTVNDDIAHVDAKDKTHAHRTVWGSDPQKLQVEFLKIDKGGHIEPSISQHPSMIYLMIVGAQNSDIEIAEEAWSFFKDKKAGLTP